MNGCARVGVGTALAVAELDVHGRAHESHAEGSQRSRGVESQSELVVRPRVGHVSGRTVEQLVEEALDAFDDPTASVAGHVRRAIRIATKRQDYPALIRLLPETFDLSVGTKVDHPAFK